VVSNARDDLGLKLNVTVPRPSKGKHGHRRTTLQAAAGPWHRPRYRRFPLSPRPRRMPHSPAFVLR
jgi:hypothetical protein